MYYIHVASGAAALAMFILAEILFYKKFLPLRKYAWASIAAAIVVNIFIVWANRRFMPMARIYLSVTYLFAFVEFALIFRVNFFTALYLSGHFVFYMFVFRAIILAAFSLALSQNIQSVIENNSYYPWVFCLSLLAALFYLYILRYKFSHTQKMQQLFYGNGHLLNFISVIQFFFSAFLLVIHQGYAYNAVSKWLSFAHLAASVFTLFVLELILYYTVKVNRLLEYEVHTVQLKKQLERQLQHYKSYQKYTESFRIFMHDYKDMMISVKTLLKKQDTEKAIKLIDSIHDELQKKVSVHQNYSNNILLDAIMQDTANQCRENSIRFAAVAYLPESIPLSELDISRIFSNLTKNAVEACLQVENPERFIEIKSCKNNDWVTIETTNSFSGKISIRDGELETAKPNKEIHGLGIKAIKDIIEGFGGIVQIDVKEHESVFSIFTIKLHIPVTK